MRLSLSVIGVSLCVAEWCGCMSSVIVCSAPYLCMSNRLKFNHLLLGCYVPRQMIFTWAVSWIWLPLTSTAHHPWTTSPIMHCTHTFPSTITPITQLSPFTHQPWLPHHTCTSFSHSHKSSTQTLTQCEVLFFPWLTFPSVFPSLSSRVLPGLLTPSPDCLLPASLTLPAFW